MTHDELLIETGRRLQIALYSGDAQVLHALNAVVELHKPWPGGCSHCINIEGGYLSYPCPTIQAIEKELNG